MGRRDFQSFARSNKDVVVVPSGIKIQWDPLEGGSQSSGVFASVGQSGMGFGIPTNPKNPKFLYGTSYMTYLSMPESELRFSGLAEKLSGEALELGEEELVNKKRRKGLKLKIKIGNPSMRRLISGAIAGAVSRTVVAPLETIRTHVMVGSLGHSTTEVFQNIMKSEGWKGLFRGNLVNVIRVAPSKAIEVCS